MKSIPVLFRPEQNAPAQGGSPSAEKPKHVVKSWLAQNLPVDVRGTFAPLGLNVLSRAHDPAYVERVLSLQEENGFGTRSPEVSKALPYVCGSMLAAAREALANGQVACSPTSGFHHAGYDSGGGFCTFNGLMVTTCTLLQEGVVGKVAIVDLDAHFGNGTEEIINHLQLGANVAHYTRGMTGYKSGDSVAYLIDTVTRLLEAWQTVGMQLVLFQAGADPHENDPLGGYYTSEEMRERDAAVFAACRRLRLPVAWNLAGGYQEAPGATTFAERIRPVLAIHDATMEECARVYVR